MIESTVPILTKHYQTVVMASLEESILAIGAALASLPKSNVKVCQLAQYQ